ncbi:MAG: response regulator [Anaerolineae bacterium]
MSRKILYIEDNPQSIVLVSKWLAQAGYQFASAQSGEEGIHQAQTVAPDLILIDIDLPDMNGVEVVQQLRALPGFETIPLVAFTGNVRRVDREHYLANGFDFHLGKPVTQRELLNALTELLDK